MRAQRERKCHRSRAQTVLAGKRPTSWLKMVSIRRRLRLAPERLLLDLPLAFFHGWLFGLLLEMIEDPALRIQLAAFDQEAICVLHRALGPLPLDLATPLGTSPERAKNLS